MSNPKYRAWHKGLKKMFTPEEMGRDQMALLPDGAGFWNINGSDTARSVNIKLMIPLQYTGLKDKDDKEIYEGDVFNCKRDRRHPDGGYIADTFNYHPESAEVVVFKDGCFFAGTDYLHKRLFWYERHNWDLIGSIYESPKLLEQKP